MAFGQASSGFNLTCSRNTLHLRKRVQTYTSSSAVCDRSPEHFPVQEGAEVFDQSFVKFTAACGVALPGAGRRTKCWAVAWRPSAFFWFLLL